MLVCSYCGKECKNVNSLRNHERCCPSNPDRNYKNGMLGKKGSNQFILAKERGLSIPGAWNKGMIGSTTGFASTPEKEAERRRKISEKLSINN